MKSLNVDKLTKKPARMPPPELVGGELSPDDYQALAKSYINDLLARQAGIRRVTHEQGTNILERIPSEVEDNAGLVFPYVWPGVGVEAYRLRRDNPPKKEVADGTLKDEGSTSRKRGWAESCTFPLG